MDALPPYLALPSSVVPAEGAIGQTVNAYFSEYPIPDLANSRTANNLDSIIQELQDGDELDGSSWKARALYFISASVPELAAFDAHKTFLLDAGHYAGPLIEAVFDPTMTHEKLDAIFVLSRALLLAGCYAESYLIISLTVTHINHYSVAMDTLFHAANDAYEHSVEQYNGSAVSQDEAQDSMLVPAIRDGQVRVVKYPFIPKYLYDLQESTIETLNVELDGLSNSLCIIRKKDEPASNIGGSNAETGSGGSYGIYVTRNITQGTTLFSETTVLYSDVHFRTIAPCKQCLQDIPENYLGHGTYSNYEYQKSFCDEKCARKFSRFVHVPEDLFRNVLTASVQWVHQNPGKHPLEAPEIACRAADYGGSISLSYDRHIAAAVDVLAHNGVDVFSESIWDGCVVMNILARVQHNARAFDVDEETAIAAVCRLFPLINDGNEANVEVNWTANGVGNGVRVTVVAGRDLAEGEELVVAAA